MLQLLFASHDGGEARRPVPDGSGEEREGVEQGGGEDTVLLEEPDAVDRERLLLFESHPLPMWIYDSETLRFLDVNEAAIERYGYERDEFLTLTLRDVRPASDVPLLVKAMDAITAEKRFSGTWRHQDKNGKIFWADVTSHAIEHHGRNARLAVAADITGQKRVESQLQEVVLSARCILWHALVAQTPRGLNWNVRIFNEAAAQNFLSVDFHNSGNQPRTGHLWALPEDVPGMSRISESAIFAGEQSYQLEYRCLDVKREIHWLRDDVRIEAGGQGIWNLTGVTIDITERKQSELAVRELNQTLQSLIHSSPIGVAAIDHQGVVSHWNPAAARIFGWSEGEV